jgi:hypothetical protein
MRTTTWIVALLASAVMAGGTWAETAADAKYRVDVRGGALAWGNSVEGHEPAQGAGPALAVGAGYRLTEHTEIDASAQAAAQGATLFGRTQTYDSVTAGGRYLFFGSDAVVRPWLGGEAGWYQGRSSVTTLFGGTDTRVANGGGFNVGTGFDVPLGRLVSIGADVRYHQTLGVFDDPGFVTTLANVSFHFGR